ncbi:MAG: DUF131 domain-containing protein [Candidatus Aenigmarchaeota archaeon]|nr:DUF131 domain-containing protein [Candidatus Aenigmarchaeota archaeon]
MPEQLVSLGLIIIVVGFIVLLAGLFSQVKSGKMNVEGGGIVFIGPFPIGGFATNKQIFYLLLTVSVILIIFLMLGRKI